MPKSDLKIKRIITNSKIKQARLSQIREIIQGIPKVADNRFEYDHDERMRNYARTELANEIRKILDSDPFEGREGIRPGQDFKNLRDILKETELQD